MIKIEIEYLLNTSVKVLYDRLFTPTGLCEWYADKVEVNDNIYTFEWEGVVEQAELISAKECSHVRYRWFDSEDDTYFEFIIQQHEITKEVSLLVVDFAYDEEEKEECIELWNTQIANLKRILGA